VVDELLCFMLYVNTDLRREDNIVEACSIRFLFIGFWEVGRRLGLILRFEMKKIYSALLLSEKSG